MDSAAGASIGENLQITDTNLPATNLASNSDHELHLPATKTHLQNSEPE
jgi:hypothetical protein